MNPVAIVQARTGSKRFPGKVMADINGRPMLQHVVERARMIQGLSGLVVATTDKRADDAVAILCRALGVACFMGSEDDVLDRFYRCALAVGADPILRLTADCPLLDPEASSGVLRAYRAGGYFYVHNISPQTDGWDTQVFPFLWLKRAWERAKDPYDREHVVPWIARNVGDGMTLRVLHKTIPGGAKWSVDTQEDLERVRAVA